MDNIRTPENLSLTDILPDNLLQDEQIYAAAKALDGELQLTAKDSREVLHLLRLKSLPGEVLDLLAWQWHVDYYDASLPLEIRQILVENSIPWHMRKGTAGIVREVVSAVWNGCEVKEWFSYDGDSYYFRVINITASHVDEYVIKNVLWAIKATKNVRSVLEGIWFLRETEIAHYLYMLPTMHKRHVVGPKKAEDGTAEITDYFSMTSTLHKKHAVSAKKPEGGEAEAEAYLAPFVNIHRRYAMGTKAPEGGELEISTYLSTTPTQHKRHEVAPEKPKRGAVGIAAYTGNTNSIQKKITL